MRISDWSSDVCSSDLLDTDDPGKLLGIDRQGLAVFADNPAQRLRAAIVESGDQLALAIDQQVFDAKPLIAFLGGRDRSEGRRVGNECVSTVCARWSPDH